MHAIRGKGGIAALVAVLLALVVTPLAARAAETGDLTISGFESGDTVTIYQIVDENADGFLADVGVDFEDWSAEGLSEEDRATYAGTISAAVSADPTAFASVSTTADANGTASFTGVNWGQYVVLVDSADAGTTRTYQSMIVTVPSDGSASAKYTQTPVEPGVIDKKVNGEDSINDVSVGDILTFTITVDLPDRGMAGVKDWFFRIYDRMSDGLAYVDDSFTIETASYGTVPDELYSVSFNTDDGYLFQVDLSGQRVTFFEGSNRVTRMLWGETVTITYQATISETADVENGESNYVTSSYSPLGTSDWTDNWATDTITIGIKEPADSSILELLPETGGPGAVVMAVAGLALVSCAGLILDRARRQRG